MICVEHSFCAMYSFFKEKENKIKKKKKKYVIIPTLVILSYVQAFVRCMEVSAPVFNVLTFSFRLELKHLFLLEHLLQYLDCLLNYKSITLPQPEE